MRTMFYTSVRVCVCVCFISEYVLVRRGVAFARRRCSAGRKTMVVHLAGWLGDQRAMMSIYGERDCAHPARPTAYNINCVYIYMRIRSQFEAAKCI